MVGGPLFLGHNSNRHLMLHLYCACVVALLIATVETAPSMRHPEVPEMQTEVVIVALLIVKATRLQSEFGTNWFC